MNTDILKAATMEAHKRAEASEFARAMITNKLDRWQWLNFLINQKLCYEAVEQKLPWIGQNGLTRSDKIAADISAMALGGSARPTPSTEAYVRHVGKLTEEMTLAHLYVRWLGDLHGGQIIARRLTHPCSFLHFENRDKAISDIRELIHDKQTLLITEANACFHFAERLFHEVF